MTLNLIETFKTLICNPKHTKYTKLHSNIFKRKTKKHLFQKYSNKSAVYADLYGTFNICLVIITFSFWGRSGEEAVTHR